MPWGREGGGRRRFWLSGVASHSGLILPTLPAPRTCPLGSERQLAPGAESGRDPCDRPRSAAWGLGVLAGQCVQAPGLRPQHGSARLPTESSRQGPGPGGVEGFALSRAGHRAGPPELCFIACPVTSLWESRACERQVMQEKLSLRNS